MSLDSKLTTLGVVWSNVKDGIIDDMEKYLFDKDAIIELKYDIEPNEHGYVKIDLSAYKFRAILDMAAVRYNDYVESDTASLSAETTAYKLEEYSIHGRMIIIKTDTVAFVAKIRLMGCAKTYIKNDVENELKLFYLSLLERSSNNIYASMTRLSNSYKNTISENSQNIEVQRVSYGIVKLNRL